MFHFHCATLLSAFTLVSSVFIQVPSPLAEGSSLTITCLTRGTGAGGIVLNDETGRAASNGLGIIRVTLDSMNTTIARFDYGVIDRAANGIKFRCFNRLTNQQSALETLVIHFLAKVVFAPVYQPVKGQDFTAVSTLFNPGNPSISSVRVSYQGSVITKESGVTVFLTNSVLSVVFSNVSRTASGSYEVSLPNSDGSYNATFRLDVRYPPEFSGVELVRNTQLTKGSSFTFNCTPSAANPAPSFSFMRNGSTYTEPAGNINGPVLTISSVVRADTGNYSCTATNTAGSTTLYYNLLVVDTVTFIIAVVIVVVGLVLIALIMIAIICIICCLRVKKNRGIAKLGGKKSHTEPVYDGIKTALDVGTSVEMQGNPAYGTAESTTTTAKPIPGPVGPEYEVVDVKGEEEKNAVKGEEQYSNLSML